MKTSELSGAALDWAVAKCKGYKEDIDFNCDSGRLFLYRHAKGLFNYSTNWAQGGPIIEREQINTSHIAGGVLAEILAWVLLYWLQLCAALLPPASVTRLMCPRSCCDQ